MKIQFIFRFSLALMLLTALTTLRGLLLTTRHQNKTLVAVDGVSSQLNLLSVSLPSCLFHSFIFFSSLSLFASIFLLLFLDFIYFSRFRDFIYNYYSHSFFYKVSHFIPFFVVSSRLHYSCSLFFQTLFP